MCVLEKKVHQLVVGCLDGYSIGNAEYEDYILRLVRGHIGGFIVFGGRRDDVRAFVARLQDVAPASLFIASDIEGGVAKQIEDTTVFPSQMAVAAAINRDDPADVRLLTKMVQAIADEAAYCGINMPYIPVLDVNKNPDNPVVCTRAFSDDPEVVAWLGTRYIRVLEEAGLVSCAKYFPGHGDTMTDMHAGLPVVEKLYQELLETDVMPYRHAIVDGLSSVMVGHLNIFAIDGKPASMSVNVVTGLLRYKLGFGGLVQTDALNIGALRAFGSVPATCLNAGVDLIVNPENVEETVRELIEAVRNGEIEKERIEIALSRIERAKSKIRCAKDRPLDGAAAVIDYEKHRLLSRRITEKSITLVKGTPGFIGVGSKDTITVVLAGDDRYFASSPLRNGLGPLSVAGNADVAGRTVLLAVFTDIATWKGSSGISPELKEELYDIIGKAGKTAVVSFGSPYVLRYFSRADMLVAAYDPSEEAQQAVLKLFRGEGDFTGRLPVTIDLQYN